MNPDPRDGSSGGGRRPPPEDGSATTVRLNRLPDPGAGSSWRVLPSETGGTPVLRVDRDDVLAGFTTRLGGVSPPPADSLNLAFEVEAVDASARDRVLANRRIAGAAVGVGQDWSTVRQVHGADVVRAPEPGTRPEADAMWTDDPDRTLAIMVADCVPALLVGEGRIGSVHAGWRGLVAGVVEKAAEALDAGHAVAGPAIGPCCYEVGPEVAEAFTDRFGAEVVPDAAHVDLWAAFEAAALESGVSVVRTTRICTSCHPSLLFSHRRDGGLTGRQALVARLAR